MIISEPAIKEHVAAIERLNQRGGRMLSMVDLLRAGTLDLDMAAYLATAISRGSSFLVGAVPGGAGKTTMMGALLNFLPPECRILDAASGDVVRAALEQRGNIQTCYVSHEISNAPYHGYLWGDDARDFFALLRQGYMIATNLHADTMDDLRHHLCTVNNVTFADFQRCRIIVFLVHQGRTWNEPTRFVSAIYESDGYSPHRLLWRLDPAGRTFPRIGMSVLVPPDDRYEARVRRILEQLDRQSLFRMGDVRKRFIQLITRPDDD